MLHERDVGCVHIALHHFSLGYGLICRRFPHLVGAGSHQSNAVPF